MIKSTTLFLAVGSVVAAALNSADVAPSIHSNEDWDYEVVGEPRAADADEDRSLLRSATECITIRMSGDGDHDKNSASLEDLSSGETLWEKKAGDLPEGILDSDCIAPPAGNILKFTVNTPNGYSDGFHALFVGSLRYIRVAGDDKNDVDVECFKLINSHPYVEGAECSSAAQASAVEETASSASNPGPPEEQEAVEIPFSSRMGCGDGKKIKVVFEKDGYNENVWYIKEKNSNKVVQECDSAGSYCKSQTVEKCLDAGDYEVVMEDKIGDGCPKFELLMENSKGNWETLSKKCYNGKNWKIHFHTKTISMTLRQQEWLEAHNKRRYVLNLSIRLVCIPSTFVDSSSFFLSTSSSGKNITGTEVKSRTMEILITFLKNGILNSLVWPRYTLRHYSTDVKPTLCHMTLTGKVQEKTWPRTEDLLVPHMEANILQTAFSTVSLKWRWTSLLEKDITPHKPYGRHQLMWAALMPSRNTRSMAT